MRTFARRAACTSLAAMAAFACTTRGSEKESPESGAAALPRPDSAEQRAAPDTTSQVVEGGSRPDASAGMPVLTGVRIDADAAPEYESLLFTFRASALPRYKVEYVTPPLSDCGQGNPVPVEGAALLHVRFEPADAHAEADGRMQATVERDPPVTGAVVAQIRRICDFEGVVEWGVGVRQRVPFRVRALNDPPRLAVDLWRGTR
jgi:hypothetical protein